MTRPRWQTVLTTAVILIGLMSSATSSAQDGGWTHWGANERSTRYAPLDQITEDNFADLEVVWVWRGDNYGPTVDSVMRSTPIYAEGKLFGVAGYRRTIVAMDPATGETLWTFREPSTKRWENSTRQNYGKGVAYSKVNGEGRIYVVTPGFFLHALDPNTGSLINDFGDGGTVDLLADLGYEYHPAVGLPPTIGYITNTSPPIIVNGVVIVGNAHHRGSNQTREENVPGHILAYDAADGSHLWKFHVIPQSETEYGFDTWMNDSWAWTGNVSAWAPLSADSQRGLVYVATDTPTNDYYGGFRPGDNLFGTSILALDVHTGDRQWHFQTVHHDIWNRDNPTAPNLLDVTIDGRDVPILVQTTKQAFAYVFNRETGEPIWPIEERQVPAGHVAGEWYSPTQPFPTKPAAYDLQGVTEDDLINFTPELREEALTILNQYEYGSLFTPPLHPQNDLGKEGALHCPGPAGGSNVTGGTSADPETGVVYVASMTRCAAVLLVSGAEADALNPNPVGWTVATYVAKPHFVEGPQGLPLFRPPYGRITAIDMNTGETLWMIPNGDTPERIKNHPALNGVDLPNTGVESQALTIVTRTLLMYSEGRGGRPLLYAVDKATGERLGTVRLPAPATSIPMSYMHQGRQYVVVPSGSDRHPGSLVALAIPDDLR